jgi:phosphopantothenoylcysteine decarboxylase/phosphopantothenate--cysteine ligase
MTNPIKDKQILLGVTGSIAAYKAVELASRLTQAGAQVDTLLTQAAIQFVTPLTFQSVTGRRAYTETDLWGTEGHIQHITLGKSADLFVIAPISANTIAKLAHGLADNLLTVTALAAACPLVIAPAMDGGMFAHPATQANLELLRQRGVSIVGPAEGHLASGMSGKGRMVEAAEVAGYVRLSLSRSGCLAGRKVVVTAGGTQEPIDPVRVIANRSSGKQGYALAQAALDLGAEVILISGPVQQATPTGALRVEVRTAQEMLEAVLSAVPGAAALIMAAAVADFRPLVASAEKIKKDGGIPEIRLENTPDILKSVTELKEKSGFPKLAVGFAAESQQVLVNAQKKLQAKRLDLIAANDISAQDAGFGADTNQVTLLYPDGKVEALPLMSKEDVADLLMGRVCELLQKKEF